MIRNRNPDLEIIRERTLKNEELRAKSLEELADELAEKLSRVHASFLFLGDQKALQKFCQHMSSSAGGIMDNAWNVLAIGLGFNRFQVECIRYSRHEDPTYLILMSYATEENAVLGHLIKELKKIRRLDAFTAVQEDLKGLAAKLEESQSENNFSDSEPALVYPPEYKKLKQELNSKLAFTIKSIEEKKEEIKTVESEVPRRKEENRVQGSAHLEENRKTNPVRVAKFNVFLTFAEDGAEIARNLTKVFRTAQGKRPAIGVLVLDEQRHKAEQNPENFIMHWFDRMNYVIPVLTEGYMRAISGKEPDDDSFARSLDARYVHYIKDLSNKYYLKNRCINKKIRCVVSRGSNILQHPHRKLDPIMMAYVYEDEIEDLARRITGTFD